LAGAKSGGKKLIVRVVSAWANANNMVLGQIRVNEKSSEIIAIPYFLDNWMIEGNLITIDALSTQTNITEKNIQNEADYILAKRNYGQLLKEIKEEFRFSKRIETDTNIDNGRIETRKCSVIANLLFVENKNEKTLGKL
jgi:predicted transposase YbfD/YdcC